MAIKLKVEGRYREAVKIYKQLHQEYSELYGFENHNHLINHADAMYYLGDFTSAVSIIDQATTIIEQNDVGEGFSSMAARIIKSRSLLEVGQVDEAEELLKTAIAYFSEKLPAGHTLLFTLDTYWLDFLLKSNRVAELNLNVAELIDGVAALKNNSNDSKRRYINTQMIGATYYWTNNQPQLALSHFKAAYNTIKEITVKQEWNYWYIVASNEQLKKQLQQNYDEVLLAQALSELFVLLPENHWYHKLFQDHD